MPLIIKRYGRHDQSISYAFMELAQWSSYIFTTDAIHNYVEYMLQ